MSTTLEAELTAAIYNGPAVITPDLLQRAVQEIATWHQIAHDESELANTLAAKVEELKVDLQRMTEERDAERHMAEGLRFDLQACRIVREHAQARLRSITARQEQLKFYLEHKAECAVVFPTRFDGAECTCGLSALLTPEPK